MCSKLNKIGRGVLSYVMLHTKYQGARHCRSRQDDFFLCFPNIKVKQRAKPRNRYNQVPQLTRDTIWESENNTQESQGTSHFPAGDHMPM